MIAKIKVRRLVATSNIPIKIPSILIGNFLQRNAARGAATTPPHINAPTSGQS